MLSGKEKSGGNKTRKKLTDNLSFFFFLIKISPVRIPKFTHLCSSLFYPKVKDNCIPFPLKLLPTKAVMLALRAWEEALKIFTHLQ